jgi:hypothetical protein
MTRTIEAVFESYYTANQAVRALQQNGLSRDMIDICNCCGSNRANGMVTSKKQNTVKPEVLIDGTGAGAQLGAGVGSAWGIAGGLLAVLGALHVPGISSATIALAAVVIAGGFAGIGGLLGGLVGLGVPEQETRQYAKNVREGEVVITILADWDSVDSVMETLHLQNPLEVKEKAPTPTGKPGRCGFGEYSAGDTGWQEQQ